VPGKSYAISFVASLVSAFVLGKIYFRDDGQQRVLWMKVGFAIWLGFVTTVQIDRQTLRATSQPSCI